MNNLKSYIISYFEFVYLIIFVISFVVAIPLTVQPGICVYSLIFHGVSVASSVLAALAQCPSFARNHHYQIPCVHNATAILVALAHFWI